MNSNARVILAVLFAAVFGASVFVVLLPWGNPCSFSQSPNINCASVSSLDEGLRNAVFVLLCVVVGTGAALVAGSLRHAAGVAGAVLAIVGAHFAAGWVYGVEASEGELFDYLKFLLMPAFLGLVGGHLSRYVVRPA
jgi:hypothetical protein